MLIKRWLLEMRKPCCAATLPRKFCGDFFLRCSPYSSRDWHLQWSVWAWVSSKLCHTVVFMFHFKLKQATAELVLSENTFSWWSQLTPCGWGPRWLQTDCHPPDKPWADRYDVVSRLLEQALFLMGMPTSNSTPKETSVLDIQTHTHSYTQTHILIHTNAHSHTD